MKRFYTNSRVSINIINNRFIKKYLVKIGTINITYNWSNGRLSAINLLKLYFSRIFSTSYIMWLY